MVSSYMVSGFVKERASTSVIDILATVLLASRYGTQGWEMSAVSPQAAALDVQHTVCMRCLSFGRGSRADCKNGHREKVPGCGIEVIGATAGKG